jgi:hypothetical protein
MTDYGTAKDARKPTKGVTFGECADRLIETMQPCWRNAKHRAQWTMTLKVYAAPLRRLPVDVGHANMSNTIGYVRMSPEPLKDVWRGRR